MEGAKKAKAASAKGASGNKVLEKAQAVKIAPGEYKYDNQEGRLSQDALLTLQLFYTIWVLERREQI
jgi:hypothetical protein